MWNMRGSILLLSPAILLVSAAAARAGEAVSLAEPAATPGEAMVVAVLQRRGGPGSSESKSRERFVPGRGFEGFRFFSPAGPGATQRKTSPSKSGHPKPSSRKPESSPSPSDAHKGHPHRDAHKGHSQGDEKGREAHHGRKNNCGTSGPTNE